MLSARDQAAAERPPHRDGLSNSPFYDVPEGPLNRIAHYCTMQSLGRLAQACEAFHRIFSAIALEKATGTGDILTFAGRIISDQVAETRRMLRRYEALPLDLQAELPKEAQELAEEVKQTLHHGQAKELEAFLDCRDNLLFWKRFGRGDAQGRPIDLSVLKTIAAYIEKHQSIPKNLLTDAAGEFDLSSLSLTSIPTDFFWYTTVVIIRELNLSKNFISTLPHDLERLVNLHNDNQLCALPKAIGRLSKLEILWLESNRLSSLPSEIGSLLKLRGLELHNNPLVSYPPELWSLDNLKTLSIDQPLLLVSS